MPQQEKAVQEAVTEAREEEKEPLTAIHRQLAQMGCHRKTGNLETLRPRNTLLEEAEQEEANIQGVQKQANPEDMGGMAALIT